METWFAALVAWGTGTAVLAIALFAAAHVVLSKRDPQAALGWLGLIWLAPMLGPVLYWGFGINRIRRKARHLRERYGAAVEPGLTGHASEAAVAQATGGTHLPALARLVERVAGQPLLGGNAVVLLRNGDEAFPALLEALDGAQRSITLCTYLFDDDQAGHLVSEALVRAMQRGVAVRVLVDSVGARYSHRSMVRHLARAGVPARTFLPTLLPWRATYINLRNHRKIAVVDGHTGFTGGMNIRDGCWLAQSPDWPFLDVHARLRGPVVAQLQAAFANDWAFAAGEELTGPDWFPPLQPAGPVLCRVIPDGPDEDLDKLRETLHGALTTAQQRVRVVTPYFLPDAALIEALKVAALRGVAVDVVLPAQGNLRLVQWATRALLGQILERGCRVWLTPRPFDHAKLMVVDGAWCLLGSANWDPRSLRLNFELNVECYGRDLAAEMERLVEDRIATARELSLAEVNDRSVPERLRDGIARLASPYL